MPTYLEKITAAQAGINSFYRLLNIYKLSKLNNGWINSEEIPSNVNLSKFKTYLDDNFKNLSDSISSTLFDIPMSSRGYDKYGNYGAGIPCDTGFTRNVPLNSDGVYAMHEPLYKIDVSDDARVVVNARASKGANIYLGGVIEYHIDHNNYTIEAYLNGNQTNPIVVDCCTLNPDIASDSKPKIYPIIPSNVVWNGESWSDSNHLNMLYCFASATASTGLRVYVTHNFINWNVHQIIYDYEKYLLPETSNLDQLQTRNLLYKYFRILPNNNYLIMQPGSLYDCTDKSTMVKMYSPYSNNPLMTIKDPYYDKEDETCREKAIQGFSSYLTENGEVVLYYNNMSETPMILYNGRIMGTYEGEVSDNYRCEIIESPKIAKIYGAPISSSRPYSASIDNMAMDCAVNILDGADIPAASVNISYGDAGKTSQDTIDDSISLYVNKSIDMIDNIDIDFSEYICGKNINGEKFLSNEIDIERKDVITWKEGTIYITDEGWWSICYGNGMFVVISTLSDDMAYSYDGIKWSKGSINNAVRYWSSVCYGNGMFVAVATESDIFAYSYNGIDWTEGTISDTERDWQLICYGNGMFVAIARYSNIFAYSYDGIDWTEGTISDTERTWCSVCYGNGMFIAVAGYGYGYAYSYDGITWTEVTISDTNRNWSSVCYGNGMFIAVVYESDTFAYSYDGITWTEVTISDTDRNWSSVCYGNGMFIAVADESDTFAYSYNGIDWTEGTISDTDRNWSSVCYGNGMFIAVSRYSKNSAYFNTMAFPYEAIISENNKLSIVACPDIYNSDVRYRATIFGNTMISGSKLVNNPSLRERLIVNTVSCDYGGGWYSVCYGNDKFVAVDWDIFGYSTDGRNWTTLNMSYSYWDSVCYGNGIFVAVGRDIFAYSTDGIDWTEESMSNADRYWHSVCYGNDKFVAVCGNNIFAYSTNGTEWTEGTISDNIEIELYRVCYGNGMFVGIGFGNIIAYSTNGLEWEEGTISDHYERSWISVCYGNGMFVAVGESFEEDDENTYNIFAYSTNGKDWTEGLLSDYYDDIFWSSVCYGNGMFVAVGAGESEGTRNIIAYSTDGIIWREGTIEWYETFWSSVCYGNGMFVGLGYGYTIANIAINNKKTWY